MYRERFIDNIRVLKAACDQVQPLADYDGNLDAIVSLMTLKAAADQISLDIDGLLEARPAGREEAS